MHIGIYIYDNAEVLDFSGPFEVFSTANRFLAGDRQHKVSLMAQKAFLVHARGGFRVQPDFSISEHPPVDVLVVVGGVHTHEVKKAAVIDWIADAAKSAKVVASVCTGAFLLAQAGLLDGRDVTTHWEDCDDLQKDYPSLTVKRNVRWLRSDQYFTSAGISAGIDMSLALVAFLYDKTIAEKTARQMEYDWVHHPD
ncbi:DJ-1/PfpI family protein [Aestuariibacter sp. GS-14]|uniref:DJ-1/PfpI family protein n=1 Tax=Aestuariibacter sp. GS-14 TaxID=2590670 RepID=UPI00112BF569|nr:DJ-1/PfpI family protein [Aestuariibacter sp. GS-14]TPV58528.1 DJ-1/PfpI family protein [Aestuariibacter sp. GS-14]